MRKKVTVYVVQDSYDYGEYADTRPVRIVPSLDEAKREAVKRVKDAKQDIVDEKYAPEESLVIRKISPLRIGVFHDEEGLLEEISIFRQKLQTNN